MGLVMEEPKISRQVHQRGFVESHHRGSVRRFAGALKNWPMAIFACNKFRTVHVGVLY